MRPALLVVGLCSILAGPLHGQAGLDSLVLRARVDSNDAVAHFELGRALLEARRFDEAERSLQTAVQLAPQYAEAWLALGVLPEWRGEEFWKQLRKSAGDSGVRALANQNDRYLRRAFLNDPLVPLSLLPRAEERVSIRIAGQTVFVWWRMPLGKALNQLRAGKFQEAIDRLDKLVADQKAGPEAVWAPDLAFWYRGIAAAHLGRYSAAVDDFWRLVQRALRREQEVPEAASPMRTNEYRYMLATMLYLDGRFAPAIQVFQRSLEFDAGLYQSHMQLARMYERAERWEEALAARQAAIAANPDDPGLVVDYAATLLRAERRPEALAQLRLAEGLAPRDPRIPYLAGVTALQLGDSAAARTELSRFIALAPSRFTAQIQDARRQLAVLP